jgi:putative transposase
LRENPACAVFSVAYKGFVLLEVALIYLAFVLHAAYISWMHRETLVTGGLLRLQLAHALRIIRKQKKRFTFSNWTRCVFAWYYHWKGATHEVIATVSEQTIRLWNESGFRYAWKWRSRAPVGRPQTPQHIRLAVLQMKRENPRWKAQKIAYEIMLAYGFEIDRKTVDSILTGRRPQRPRPDKEPAGDKDFVIPASAWADKLALGAPGWGMDFFTATTWNFQIYYAFFIISHATREVLHVGVTKQPHMGWVRNQLKAAFSPDVKWPEFLVFDNDPVFRWSEAFMRNILGVEPARTRVRSPWQNGVAERWVGTVREELLNRVLVKNEAHLVRLLKEYVSYYNKERAHSTLGGYSPGGRVPPDTPPPPGKLIRESHVSGLHAVYRVAEAA